MSQYHLRMFSLVQGCRGGNGSDWYAEGDLSFLDSPHEFHYDPHNSTLYFVFNGTKPPSKNEIFSAPTLETLLSIHGTQQAPVTDLTVTNIGFRDAAPTYMAPHGVDRGEHGGCLG